LEQAEANVAREARENAVADKALLRQIASQQQEITAVVTTLSAEQKSLRVELSQLAGQVQQQPGQPRSVSARAQQQEDR
jgi:hypothetical protein